MRFLIIFMLIVSVSAVAAPAHLPPQTVGILTRGRVAGLRDLKSNRLRAELLWASLKENYGPDLHHLTERLDTDHRADNWALGQVLVAALDVAALTGQGTDFGTLYPLLDHYKKPGGGYAATTDDEHGTGDRYYDDNAWLGLAMLQAAQQFPGDSRRYLSDTDSIYQFLQTGLRPDGGLLWVENGDQYCFPSFGGGAEMALHLYLATHEARYLQFAQALDRYMDAHFLLHTGPKAGLYADNFHPGKDDLNENIWSYNQGTALGTKALLFRATGDKQYLVAAHAIADASMTWFGHFDRLWKQPPAFNAVYARNLLALSSDARYTEFVHRYTERLWRQAVDPDSGLLRISGAMGYYGDSPGGLIDQAAATQLFAIQAWPLPNLHNLTLHLR